MGCKKMVKKAKDKNDRKKELIEISRCIDETFVNINRHILNINQELHTLEEKLYSFSDKNIDFNQIDEIMIDIRSNLENDINLIIDGFVILKKMFDT